MNKKQFPGLTIGTALSNDLYSISRGHGGIVPLLLLCKARFE